MKYTQLQTDLIKNLDRKKQERFFYDYDGENYILISNNFMLCKCFKPLVVVDFERLNKLEPGSYQRKDLKQFTVNSIDNFGCILDDEYREIKNTGNIVIKNKDSFLKLKDEKTTAYINIKNLKYFDKDCTFYVKNSFSAILIFERNSYCGLVMPARVIE